ncbi:MAG: hypothetical protein IAG13_06840, partial [Deltaproteobacteria bacterium]|nr:hypothetical protein [Nannocystaceae bacterium]
MPTIASSTCRDEGVEAVVLDGCAAWVDDDRCIVGAQLELRLWRPSWTTGCTLTVDGAPIDVHEQEIDGGWLSAPMIVPGAQLLALHGDPDAVATWEVQLAQEPAAPLGSPLARMREAIALRRASFVREDWTATVAAADDAFTRAMSLARWSEACASAFAAAHVLAEGRGALDEARAWLARTDA